MAMPATRVPLQHGWLSAPHKVRGVPVTRRLAEVFRVASHAGFTACDLENGEPAAPVTSAQGLRQRAKKASVRR